jgi:hypothetical protein
MWHAASVYLRTIEPVGPESRPLWEERILLIEAPSVQDAGKLAESLGRDAEHEYAAEGQTIHWVFVSVGAIRSVESAFAVQGAELMCRYIKESDAISLQTPFE